MFLWQIYLPINMVGLGGSGAGWPTVRLTADRPCCAWTAAPARSLVRRGGLGDPALPPRRTAPPDPDPPKHHSNHKNLVPINQSLKHLKSHNFKGEDPDLGSYTLTFTECGPK